MWWIIDCGLIISECVNCISLRKHAPSTQSKRPKARTRTGWHKFSNSIISIERQLNREHKMALRTASVCVCVFITEKNNLWLFGVYRLFLLREHVSSTKHSQTLASWRACCVQYWTVCSSKTWNLLVQCIHFIQYWHSPHILPLCLKRNLEKLFSKKHTQSTILRNENSLECL